MGSLFRDPFIPGSLPSLVMSFRMAETRKVKHGQPQDTGCHLHKIVVAISRVLLVLPELPLQDFGFIEQWAMETEH